MFAEILKIVLPALMVFLAGHLALRAMLNNDAQRRRTELLFNTTKITLPLRLQAYERLMLFLERISPDSIIMRTSKSNMSAGELQVALLAAIRSEWEHNLSQQLYVSREAWDLVKNAKENIKQIINVCAERVEPTEPAIVLSKRIFDTMIELNINPIHTATDYLRSEVKEIL